MIRILLASAATVFVIFLCSATEASNDVSVPSALATGLLSVSSGTSASQMPVPVVEVIGSDPYIVGTSNPVRVRGANLATGNIARLIIYLPPATPGVEGGFPRRLVLEPVTGSSIYDPEFAVYPQVCATAGLTCPAGLYPIYLSTGDAEDVPNGISTFVQIAYPATVRAVAIYTLPFPVTEVDDLQRGISVAAVEAVSRDEPLSTLVSYLVFDRPTAVDAHRSNWTVGAWANGPMDARAALNEFLSLGLGGGKATAALFSQFRIKSSSLLEVYDEVPCGLNDFRRVCTPSDPPAPLRAEPAFQSDVIVLVCVAVALALTLITLITLFRLQKLCFKPKHVTFDIDVSDFGFADVSALLASPDSSAVLVMGGGGLGSTGSGVSSLHGSALSSGALHPSSGNSGLTGSGTAVSSAAVTASFTNLDGSINGPPRIGGVVVGGAGLSLLPEGGFPSTWR